MTTGERIAQLRRAAGLSQEQLAEALEVSRQAVSKWETGQALPDTDRIARLCALFSVSADELLGLPTRQSAQDSSAPAQPDGAQRLAQAAASRGRFIAGWITAALGVLTLIAAYLALWPIRNAAVDTAAAHGLGYRIEVMWYASQPPLSVVFVLGGVLIVAGVGLIAANVLLDAKSRKKTDRP
ncbi:MAG: helix-turn-helix transcriptional regulator [Candidatus Spyradocola sp.]